MEHNGFIDWPNGKGVTLCSLEYQETMEKRDTLRAKYEDCGLDDMEPEDYQEWSVLDNRLNEMQISGHVGESVKF